jgi:hypothetical protein
MTRHIPTAYCPASYENTLGVFFNRLRGHLSFLIFFICAGYLYINNNMLIPTTTMDYQRAYSAGISLLDPHTQDPDVLKDAGSHYLYSAGHIQPKDQLTPPKPTFRTIPTELQDIILSHLFPPVGFELKYVCRRDRYSAPILPASLQALKCTSYEMSDWVQARLLNAYPVILSHDNLTLTLGRLRRWGVSGLSNIRRLELKWSSISILDLSLFGKICDILAVAGGLSELKLTVPQAWAEAGVQRAWLKMLCSILSEDLTSITVNTYTMQQNCFWGWSVTGSCQDGILRQVGDGRVAKLQYGKGPGLYFKSLVRRNESSEALAYIFNLEHN